MIRFLILALAVVLPVTFITATQAQCPCNTQYQACPDTSVDVVPLNIPVVQSKFAPIKKLFPLRDRWNRCDGNCATCPLKDTCTKVQPNTKTQPKGVNKVYAGSRLFQRFRNRRAIRSCGIRRGCCN